MVILEENRVLWEYRLQFFAGDSDDKTEEPTDKKLDDARDEGQVAKSREVANCVSLLALFLVLKFWTQNIGNQFINVFQVIYREIPHFVTFPEGEMPVLETRIAFRQLMYFVLMIVLPILLVALITTVLSDLLQVRWHPTTKPMKPKLSKLNPISGFKRMFSANSMMELLKSIVKLGLILAITYSFVQDKALLLLSFYDRPLIQSIGLIGELVTDLGIRISAMYIVVAAGDFMYQKWKFHKDMKMTKQEVKDEYKNAEGDPQVKGKIKQRMQEASRRRMMQALPQADVVITNPTHYAVAIKYDPGVVDAPYVLAKGEGYLAQRIKEIARENKVEIVENKPLARMLYHNVEIGETVPPELYQAVAEVLAFVYQLQGKI